MNVVLAGFNFDGSHFYHLEEGALQSSLMQSMEVHSPACLETKEKLHVHYKLEYEVQHADSTAVKTVEDVLSEHLVFQGMTSQDHFIYDVDVVDIEDAFNDIYGESPSSYFPPSLILFLDVLCMPVCLCVIFIVLFANEQRVMLAAICFDHCDALRKKERESVAFYAP